MVLLFLAIGLRFKAKDIIISTLLEGHVLSSKVPVQYLNLFCEKKTYEKKKLCFIWAALEKHKKHVHT